MAMARPLRIDQNAILKWGGSKIRPPGRGWHEASDFTFNSYKPLAIDSLDGRRCRDGRALRRTVRNDLRRLRDARLWNPVAHHPDRRILFADRRSRRGRARDLRCAS